MTRTLDAAAFWKLRAICADAQRWAVAAAAARDALLAADQRQAAYLREIGIDPKTPTFQLDEEALTVTIPDPPP
jgi:hypothetical protein